MASPNPAKLRAFSLFLIVAGILLNGYLYTIQQDFYRLTFVQTNVREAPGLIAEKQPSGRRYVLNVVFTGNGNATRSFTTTVGTNEPYQLGDRVVVVYDDTGERLYAMLATEKASGWFIVGLGAFIFLVFSYAAIQTVAQARVLERK